MKKRKKKNLPPSSSHYSWPFYFSFLLPFFRKYKWLSFSCSPEACVGMALQREQRVSLISRSPGYWRTFLLTRGCWRRILTSFIDLTLGNIAFIFVKRWNWRLTHPVHIVHIGWQVRTPRWRHSRAVLPTLGKTPFSLLHVAFHISQV